MEKGRTVVLIIDEGQKIRENCLEYLREFLNYETNDRKLVQIVIFAQSEFAEAVRQYSNFADRVHLSYRLGPLNYQDTVRMIRFRLSLAGGLAQAASLFTRTALWAVYRAARGYPRRIIHICHHCLIAMIIRNKTRINARTVAFCVRQHQSGLGLAPRRSWVLALTASLLVVAVAASAYHWAARSPADITTLTAALLPTREASQFLGPGGANQEPPVGHDPAAPIPSQGPRRASGSLQNRPGRPLVLDRPRAARRQRG